MKLFDKVKNFFYDEEEVEVSKEELSKITEEKNRVENKKNQPLKKEKKDDKPVEAVDNVDDIVSERELFKSESTFKFPIIFEDDDFSSEKKKNKGINVLDFENTKIKDKKPQDFEKQKFSPSPIISPIYGVLGENYNKDNKVERDDNFFNLYDNDETVDIDKVIGKAYGREEKRNQEKSSVVNEEKVVAIEEKESIDLFKDLEEEQKLEFEETKENEDLEYKSDYKMPDEVKMKSIDELLESTDEQDFYKLVDSMYDEETKENIE